MNKKCSDCGRVHAHQVVDYPMGAVVVVKNDFFGGFDMNKYDPLNMPADQAPRVIIPAGSLGYVVGHTEDGRALIEFEAENGHSKGSHSFHHPEGYFRLKETERMNTANLQLEEIKKTLNQIERLIDRKKKQATLYRESNNEITAKYFDGEANGLQLAYHKLITVIEAE